MKKRIMLFTILGVGSSLMLAGCSAGPTYGTGQTTGSQLIDDISGITSIGNINKTKRVETRPRPDLVPPSSNASVSNLPPPQENVVRAGSTDWPESPEERRQRIRNEATANQNNPYYRAKVTGSASSDDQTYLPDGVDRRRERESFMPSAQESKKQRADYLSRKKDTAGGNAQQRKYLSEPPLDYREPSATAPIGDTGETEAKKERERKKEMAGKKGWWPF